jgi:hypothetical protein
MSNPKKYRKCPHCKSVKGFRVTIILAGYQEEVRDFSGNMIDASRHGADRVEKMVECLECKKLIPTENVKIDL